MELSNPVWQWTFVTSLAGLILSSALTHESRLRGRAWMSLCVHGFGFFALCQDILFMALFLFAVIVIVFLFWMNRQFVATGSRAFQPQGTHDRGRRLLCLFCGVVCGLVACVPQDGGISVEVASEEMDPYLVVLLGFLLLMMFVVSVRCMAAAEIPPRNKRVLN